MHNRLFFLFVWMLGASWNCPNGSFSLACWIVTQKRIGLHVILMHGEKKTLYLKGGKKKESIQTKKKEQIRFPLPCPTKKRKRLKEEKKNTVATRQQNNYTYTHIVFKSSHHPTHEGTFFFCLEKKNSRAKRKAFKILLLLLLSWMEVRVGVLGYMRGHSKEKKEISFRVLLCSGGRPHLLDFWSHINFGSFS